MSKGISQSYTSDLNIWESKGYTIGFYTTANGSNTPTNYRYGYLTNYQWDSGGGYKWSAQFYLTVSDFGHEIFTRGYRSDIGAWTSWKKFINDANIGDYNAGSATKLQTARTLWGQSFDGSGNVTGSLSSVTNVDSLVYFDTTNTRVGIDKSSPAYTLDVNGSVGVTSGITLTSTKKIYFGDSSHYIELDSSGYFHFSHGVYSDGFVSALGLNSGGGGAADYIPLSGSTNITGNLVPETDGACNLGSSTKKWGSIYCYSITGNASLSTQSVSCTYLTTTSNVSIGSSINFSYKLYVNGTSNFNGLVVGNTGSGSGIVDYILLDASGNNKTVCLKGVSGAPIYGTGSYQNISDIRLKNIVSYIDKDVNDIANAPIFNFTFKDAKVQNVMLGTSAQYWQKYLPHGVSIAPNGYLSMDYGSIALAAAVLTARKVVDHEARIRLLEVENAALRNEINQLKKVA